LWLTVGTVLFPPSFLALPSGLRHNQAIGFYLAGSVYRVFKQQGIGLLLGNGHWFFSFSLVSDNQLHSYLYTLGSVVRCRFSWQLRLICRSCTSGYPEKYRSRKYSCFGG
jgi:hypothetical protein